MLFLKMLSLKCYPTLVLLALFGCVGLVKGQHTAAIDQLIDAKTAKAKSLVYANAKVAAKVADTVIQLSRKHGRPLSEATGWNLKGIVMHFIGSSDSAMIYFQKTEEIGLRVGDKLTLAKAKQNKNLVYSKLGQYDKALASCFESLKLYQQLGNKMSQASCMGDIGNIFIRSNRPAQAVEYLQDALALAEEIKDDGLKPNFYNSLAVAYMDLNQYASARQTYLKALPLAEKFNRVNNQISILMNLGDLAWQHGKDANQAINYYQKAEKLAISFGDDGKLSAIYQDLGNIKSATGAYREAMDYALRARDLAVKSKDLVVQERVFNSLANYASKAGNFKQAYEAGLVRDSLYRILFDKRATENMNELQARYNDEKKQLRIAALGQQNQIQQLELGKNGLQLKNNALTLAKNGLQLRNQALSITEQQQLLEQNRLETQAKSQQVKLLDAANKLQKAQLKQRNITIGVVLALVALSILIGYLLYNRHRLKQQRHQQQLKIQQQRLAAEAVIHAEANERERIAGELHDGLGQLFSAVKMNLSGISEHLDFQDVESRDIFHKTIDLVDESCKEVRVISHQMAPNLLLKSGLGVAIRNFISKIDSRKLKINLETSGLQDRLGQHTESVLYRVVQEAVNNVIKHAGASSLDIQLRKDEEGISMTIEDNGKGFDVADTENSKGLGLKNIRSRIEFLQGDVDFSSTIGQGTLLAIHIPTTAP
jgi:two-component system NarL family sensor kinase